MVSQRTKESQQKELKKKSSVGKKNMLVFTAGNLVKKDTKYLFW